MALAELARAAPVAEQPPPLLLALGERLHLAGGDGIGLLRRVQEQYPDDFWANFTAGPCLVRRVEAGQGRLGSGSRLLPEGAGIRPKAVAVQNNLGLVLIDVGWLEDNADGRWGPGAITIFREPCASTPISPRPATTSACA